MAYHAKKVLEKIDLPESVLSMLNLKNLKDIKKNAVIALLDDFSGTGESILSFYEKSVKPIVERKPITTVIYMEKGRKNLESNCGLNVYGDLSIPAFARRGSVFGYEKSMIPVRDFCFKKAEKLFPNWKYQDLKPLGYKPRKGSTLGHTVTHANRASKRNFRSKKVKSWSIRQIMSFCNFTFSSPIMTSSETAAPRPNHANETQIARLLS